MRNLVLVLADQLAANSEAFEGFEKSVDRVWMSEAAAELDYVWSHKARITLFLSAMRHFRDSLKKKGIRVEYSEISARKNKENLGSELRKALRNLKPAKLIVGEPGEWRVRDTLGETAREHNVTLEVRPDRSFICSSEDFTEHASARKRLIMEFFYRELRHKTGALMNGKRPAGGKWNYDPQNRKSFSKDGPEKIPEPVSFPPDTTTRSVINLAKKRFPDHPGELDNFDWPVTPQQAKRALHDFMENRLPSFGTYQDAMWAGNPYLYHSRLSSSLNLKLLDPSDVVTAAQSALRNRSAPLNSVEGFIRQVLGWREYVRGIYCMYMPDYIERNALDAHLPLPWFYWTGDTDMNCLRECIGQTLQYGYAHHIQRLMVTGLFALLLGVEPREVHKWYLAMYVDAVEWVELPNTLGMSQFADGGIMATKPYAASGAYIRRMSNYCISCRYSPSLRTGDTACPFNVLYWAFLMRNEGKLRRIPRMGMQLNNLGRIEKKERAAIRRQAEAVGKSATRYKNKPKSP
jgi:deoxyribodipyrimidine photolyase-related protein